MELFDPPTNDFLKWDGTKFRIPSRRGGQCVPPWATGWSRREGQGPPKVSRREGHTADGKCPVVEDITSLTTPTETERSWNDH